MSAIRKCSLWMRYDETVYILAISYVDFTNRIPALNKHFVNNCELKILILEQSIWIGTYKDFL